METKGLVTGTVVGGITVFVLGYLIFDTAFAAFYTANVGSSGRRGAGRAIGVGCCAGVVLVRCAHHACDWEPNWFSDDGSRRSGGCGGRLPPRVHDGFHLVRHHEHRKPDEDHRRPFARTRPRRDHGRCHGVRAGEDLGVCPRPDSSLISWWPCNRTFASPICRPSNPALQPTAAGSSRAAPAERETSSRTRSCDNAAPVSGNEAVSALHHGACYRRLSDVPCSLFNLRAKQLTDEELREALSRTKWWAEGMIGVTDCLKT